MNIKKDFDKYLIIGLKQDGKTATFQTSKNMTFPEAMQLTFSTVLNVANATYKQGFKHILNTVPPEEQAQRALELKQEIYDAINVAASNVLELFAPELELRPDLTSEAILKAENEILDHA